MIGPDLLINKKAHRKRVFLSINNSTTDNLSFALGFNSNVSPSIKFKHYKGSVKGPLVSRRIIFNFVQIL